MAKIVRCQTVLIGNRKYYYGDTVPYFKWTQNGVTKEIWNARISAVSGIRENNASFDGVDINGNPLSVSVDMDNIVEPNDVIIKKGAVLKLNDMEVTITDVIKGIGFFHKDNTGELRFCNTMFETLNFIPVYE